MTKHPITPLSITQAAVFVPGTLCDERIFNPCWQHLEIANRAFVPLQWAETLEQMVMLCADRLDYFDQAVHLIGYSMGGYIAALAAIQHPDKIASLTLIGSSCDVLPDTELQQRKQLIKSINKQNFTAMPDTSLKQYFHASQQGNKELMQLLKSMQQDLGAGVLVAQMTATATRKNLTGKLAKCPFPIHLIAGEQDSLVDEKTLRLALPKSDLHLVKNAGHMLPIEQPLSLARFLAEKIG
ncbi:alpha/beta fold hydrolase [Paraglaciecola aestuariivivens]